MAQLTCTIDRIDVIPLCPISWGNGDTKDVAMIQLTASNGLMAFGSSYTSAERVRACLEPYKGMLQGPFLLDQMLSHLKSKLDSGASKDEACTYSGLDIALWDLKGKMLERPVSQLLGGRVRDKIQAYASLEIPLPRSIPDREFEEKIEGALDLGFKAVKLYLPRFGYRDASRDLAGWQAYEESLIAYARKIVGPKIKLMLDAYGSAPDWPNGLEWALEAAELLGRYQFLWLEEPLPDTALEDFRSLSQQSPILITGCETFVGAAQFMKWNDAKAVSVVQPDSTLAGGVTTLAAIRDGVKPRGNIIPHGWNTAIGMAADLQVMSTVTNTKELQMVEYMPTAHLTDPIVKPFQLDESGYMAIPDGPGLGIDVDLDAIRNKTGIFKIG